MEKTKALDRFKDLIGDDRESKDEALDISRDILYLVNNALEGSSNPRLSKAVAIGSAIYTLSVAGTKFYRLYKRKNAPSKFTIKITEGDAIFEIVEAWFMEALPEESQRSVFAHSSIIRADDRSLAQSAVGRRLKLKGWDDDPDEKAKDRVDIGYSFDGTMAQSLTIAGHEVEVFTHVPETSMGQSDGNKKQAWNSRSMNIICNTVEARNAVLKEIEAQSQHLVQSRPRMFVAGRWGDWKRKAEIQPRSRESVILKEGQMDRILDYLNNFLENKEAYKKADIPFRTGVLLYGDPGSGKSSTALAIANELKMNVYIISLSSLMSDESLNDCFSDIPPNSIVILEDIDTASAAKDRDADDDKGVTMSGLLNVLDGFQSPTGVITIMTTNRLDALDTAIRRPGRVDLLEKLDSLDYAQLTGLCEYFMGHVPENLPHITPDDGVTSADIMGVIRKHLPDFHNAGEDMVAFIQGKVLTKLAA